MLRARWQGAHDCTTSRVVEAALRAPAPIERELCDDKIQPEKLFQQCQIFEVSLTLKAK